MAHLAAPYPSTRFRRLRRTPALRALTAENTLSVKDLIWPVFIQEGDDKATPIASMPGVDRLPLDRLVLAARDAANLGIPAICLFPYIDQSLKTADCADAWNPENLVNRAACLLKSQVPEIAVMSDVALDPYNIDGHDGFVVDGEILNDETVAALVKMAVAQADAGVDIIGPSDMMDGRIGAIRDALEAAGHKDTIILSYAAKFASSFYGPFRDAVGASGALTGDKDTYQIDPANSDEALRNVATDLAEGADMVMVKPGLPYLDICRRVKDEFSAPVFAYQVSGEYSMITGAAANGWIDGEKAMMESLLAFKRAGCSGILTYFAPAAARVLAR